MKTRKLSQNTKLEFVSSDFVHISQRYHPKGCFQQYVKIEKAEALQLAKHLIDWVLVEGKSTQV